MEYIQDSQYPRAGSVVDGRTVLSGPVPNTDSISASLLDYTVLPGIREVSMSHFSGPKSVFYAADDFHRSEELAKRIKATNTIVPLIIVVDKDGPYILEGGHRYVALYYLGAKSFPALVVLDNESLEESEGVKTKAWVHKNCKFAQNQSLHSLAQDYWLKVLTPDQRAEIMNKAPKPRSLLQRLRACHQYIIDNIPEFKQYVERQNKEALGDCRDEDLVGSIFGSVSEFARLIEEKGDNFIYGKIKVAYNPNTDIHTFYEL